MLLRARLYRLIGCCLANVETTSFFLYKEAPQEAPQLAAQYQHLNAPVLRWPTIDSWDAAIGIPLS